MIDKIIELALEYGAEEHPPPLFCPECGSKKLSITMLSPKHCGRANLQLQITRCDYCGSYTEKYIPL